MPQSPVVTSARKSGGPPPREILPAHQLELAAASITEKLPRLAPVRPFLSGARDRRNLRFIGPRYQPEESRRPPISYLNLRGCARIDNYCS
jgi:hypothetical protein